MLQSLSIRNIALIDSLNVNLETGLNVFSGETGSGKSIIVDSLNFLLGGRADKTLIRYGEETARVEGVFDVFGTPAQEALVELGFEREDTVIITRTFSLSGRSEIRLNGRPITLSMLRSVSEKLVDVHGQSEHQSLISVGTHLDLVDKFGKEECALLLARVGSAYDALCAVDRELSKFGGSEEERLRTVDLLEYQIEEIENAALYDGEEEELKRARTLAMNREKIAQGLAESVSMLSRGPQNASDGVFESARILSGLASYSPELDALSERLNSMRIELQDISDSLEDFADNMQFDGAEADRIEERYETIKALKRKYGHDIPAIFAYLEDAKERLLTLQQAEERIAELSKEREKCVDELYAASCDLSAVRKEVANRFENAIVRELADLGMKGSRFVVEFAPLPQKEDATFTANGLDMAEFMFSANTGEPLKPLAKVISGGEMSRFMLAVKKITCELDRIPTMIFDEIDTGISGKIARIVAEKFADVSKESQIIAITHLPQIAAMADANYLISKHVIEGKTLTRMNRLAEEEIVLEIARLSGSVELTEAARKNAEELILSATSYKKTH